MSSPKVEGCTLNPLKYELNCKTTTAATIVSALTAIVAVAGIMAILSSQGVNIGALNTLGNIGMIGGGVMAGVGGIVLLATLAWIIGKVIQHCRKNTKEEDSNPRLPSHETSGSEKKKETEQLRKQEIEEIDHSRLAKVFLETKPDSSGGTTYFKTLTEKMITLHYTGEATFWDIAEKLAVEVGVAPSQIKFIFSGKMLNQEKQEMKETMWKNVSYPSYGSEEKIPNESTVYLILRLFR